jgi:hypothetical protein
MEFDASRSSVEDAVKTKSVPIVKVMMPVRVDAYIASCRIELFVWLDLKDK